MLSFLRLFENNLNTVKMHLHLTAITRISSIVGLCLLLSHCASNPTSPRPQVDEIVLDSQQGINTNGDATYDNRQINLQRAEYYQRLASQQSNISDQHDALLSAAEYYIQANEHQQAQLIADNFNTSELNQQQSERHTIINAYIDYSAGQFDSALQKLISWGLIADPATSSFNTSDAPHQNETQKVNALLLASFCYQQLGDFDSAIAVLIQRESMLLGSARTETARYTWQLINSLSSAERLSIIEQTNNSLVRNRVDQSLQGQFTTQTELPPQFNQWRDISTPTTLQTIDSVWDETSPSRIAVLLPLTSRYSKAAHAVMDGIEYQHNNNVSAYKPSIDFYDIGETPHQANQYYTAIARMGYDLVIGPIGKDYANQLYLSNTTHTYQHVPTMLLGGDIELNGTSAMQNNYSSAGNQFTRLTMSPEAEGIEVAHYAKQQGHITVAMLVPDNQTGLRTAQAFKQHWLSQGGNINKTITYSPKQFDHSVELKQLFDISQSEYRHRKLSGVLGFKPKFLPYRRSDVDFIFMIADNKSGRIVRPQINFFSGKTVPVYATSSIFNGIQDKTNNLDLEHTQFPVMPWVLQSTEVAPYAGKLNMLFAMGGDAYQIAAKYQSMLNNPTLAIAGNMGVLNIESSREITYQPIWAEFVDGLAQTSNALPNLNVHRRSSINNQRNSTEREFNSYDDSNWDARQSSRKTSRSVP